MEALFIEIAKSSPSAILSLVMVYVFLNFIEKQSSVLREIKSDCHKWQDELTKQRDALTDRVAKALDRNSDCLSNCEASHRSLEEAVNRERQK